MEYARQFDSKVLIEEAVVGSEVGCAILGNEAELIAGEPIGLSLSHGFFRIHQENEPESGSENATFIVPADISAGRAAGPGDSKGPLSRFGMQGTGPGGPVPEGRRNGRPERGQYVAGPDLLQPLSENDGGRGLSLAEVIDRIVSLALAERSR